MDVLLIVIAFLSIPILTIASLGIVEYRRKLVVKRALEKALDQLTKENELMIVDVEFFRNKVIGIDKQNKKLVYANYGKEAINQFCIDLDLLAFCRVNTTIDKFSNGVKQIFLDVKCKDNNEVFQLNFYDRSFDDIRSKALLLEKAGRWRSKINVHRRSVNFNNQFEYVL